MRMRLVLVAACVAGGAVVTACGTDRSAIPSKRMSDGKQWTTQNLSVATDGSRCYGDAEPNCQRYGGLYTWEAAQSACRSLGDGWRLPADEEWRQLAKQYGGVREESEDLGKAAYFALSSGGGAGFNAMLGGSFVPDEGRYTRLEEHGFYWSASETGPASAWFYNFGKNGQSLNRHREGAKQMAASVRCVRE